MIDRDLLHSFCQENGYGIAESFSTPTRQERRVDLPYGYTDPAYRQILQVRGIADGRVWVHQADAMEVISSGMNAVLSTATASGKSLIFQLAAICKLRESKDQARVMVFYPTRALNSDQNISWREVMSAAGYNPSHLAVLDGGVKEPERLGLLEKARVVLMTPDVVHAWMMRNLDQPAVRQFLGNVSLKVLDEAHLYEGAFGTNMCYLLNRLKAVQQVLNPGYRVGHHDQIIMATATLNDPRRFAIQLTGTDAYDIGDDVNTAMQHEKAFTVIRTPERKQRDVLKKFLVTLHQQKSQSGILAFVDSRTGVDNLANDLASLSKNGAPGFAAYRAGFVEEDRLAVETGLRQGTLMGAIATSGLEVGIDIGGIGTVLLDRIPRNPASLRQRAGRLRRGGSVIVFEDGDGLRRLGATVEAYLAQPPLQPVFYRTNAKIMAEQALCVIAEHDVLGSDANDLPGILWPAGFTDVVDAYRSKSVGELTRVQQEAIPPREEKPHIYHSMRSMDGPTRKLLTFDPVAEVQVQRGEVTQGQALHEALPGMRMIHAGRKYVVTKWGNRGTAGHIFIRPLGKEDGNSPLTRALVRTQTLIYLNDQSILAGGLKTNGADNFMASVNLRLDRIGLGFSERVGKETLHTIFDEAAPPDGIRRDQRLKTVLRTAAYGPPRRAPINTTGVVIRIGEGTLKGTALARAAYDLAAALCEVAKVSPSDIGVLTNNVSVAVTADKLTTDRAILIYDKTPGSLLFSNKLMSMLEKVSQRLVENAERQDDYSTLIAKEFVQWTRQLKRVRVPSYDQWARAGLKTQANDNQVIVYAPGSQLTLIRDGQAERVEIAGAEMVHDELMYRVQRLRSEFSLVTAAKGAAPYRRKLYRAQDYLTRIYAKPGDLEPLERPNHRFDWFDVKTGKYAGTLGASLRELLPSAATGKLPGPKSSG